MKDVSTLAKGQGSYEEVRKARQYERAFYERKRILAETPAKRAKLNDLVPALRAADGSIIFTQTIDAAEDAVHVLRRGGLSADAIHSQLDRAERRSILERFAAGSLKAISAPEVLDEGIDVPAADLAIILAASSTRRQMIQRMGRVLRRKADGRLARFVILYVEGTSEDPGQSAHGDFLEEVTGVADAVKVFAVDASAEDVCVFLNDFRPGSVQPPPRMASDGSRSVRGASTGRPRLSSTDQSSRPSRSGAATSATP
jgi:superfamily II DNA or RNA helicase